MSRPSRIAMNFIVTPDWHWQLANPKARLDSYEAALRAKIAEVFQLAEQYDALGILVPGDIFNSPSVGYSAVGALMAVLLKAPCPIYTIAGQHDEWDHNPSSLSRTPFGLLVAANMIHDVAANPVVLRFPSMELGLTVEITGRHYDTTADTSPDYYEKPRTEPWNFQIMLSHGLLLDRSSGYELKHTLVSQLTSRADVICVGDYHTGIGIQTFSRASSEQDGLVVSPGALARVKALSAELERQVQVAVLTVTLDGASAELIPLTSARPGHEVLSREHLEAQARQQAALANFVGIIIEENVNQFLETEEIFHRIAQSEKLPKRVVDEALEYRDKARETLGAAA